MDNGLRILNSFVVDHKRAETSFSQENFISNMKFFSEATTIDSKIINQLYDSTIYGRYIAKAVDNLNAMRSVDYSYLDKFFSDVYTSKPLEGKAITIGLQDMGEIEKIRPEYLSSIPVYFDNYLKAILTGKKKKSDVDREVISGSFKDKVKRQLVKTTLTVNDTRDLMKIDSPNLVKVDEIFIANNIIPFIRAYAQEIDFLNRIAEQTIARIGNANNDIKSSIDALNGMIADNKLDPNTILTAKYFAFNMQSQYMSVCAYISAMLIRKIAYYTYNMRAIQHLYNLIIAYFPEAEGILHESVLDGKLDDIDSTELLNSMIGDDLSIILPKIHDVVNRKKIEIANVAAKYMNMKLSAMDDINHHDGEYDNTPYLELGNTFDQIAQQLHNFELAIKDPDAIMDDVLTKLGLDTSYVARFTGIVNKARDTSAYDAMLTNHMTDAAAKSLYNEISEFEKNVSDISSKATKVYVYIQALEKAYDVNNGHLDNPTYIEAKEIIENIMSDYKDYCLSVARCIVNRLDNLSNVLIENFDDERKIVEAVVYPSENIDIYEAVGFVASYDYVLKESADIFTELMKDYKAMKAHRDRGVKLVYEAEQVPADGSGNGGGNNQASANGNGTQGGGDNNGGGQVKTAEVNIDGQPKTVAQKEADSNNGKNNANEKGIIQAFLDAIKKIKDQWLNKMRQLMSKNGGWLGRVTNKLKSLDPSNITISIAPYEAVNENTITNLFNTAKTKINSISPDNLPNEIKNGTASARKFIFPEIPDVKRAESWKQSLSLYFTWGKSASIDMKQNKLMVYKGDEATQQINTMIDYCANYDKLANTIDRLIEDLDKVAADKQTAIINSKSGNNEQNQAQQNNDKTNMNNVITTVVSDFNKAIFTATEKKYMDYFHCLRKLAPQDAEPAPKKEEKKGENNNDQNTEGEQQGESK